MCSEKTCKCAHSEILCECARNHRGGKRSVHYEQTERFDKAEEQLNKAPKTVDEIINLTNSFLQSNGLKPVDNPKFTSFSVGNGRQGYRTVVGINDGELENKINDHFGLVENPLNDSKHVIWMKFAKNGQLGVVAASNDYNFDIPPSSDVYDETTNGKPKCKCNKWTKWKYTTSGIILHKLNLEWDESFLLIFPLHGIENIQRRNLIEKGIGNFLLKNDVPIIDFYSHK